MPIAAAMNPMKEMIKLALSLGQGATNDGIAGAIVSALSSTVVMGIKPFLQGLPVTPVGASGTLNLYKNSLSLSQGASNSSIAQIMAGAIAVLDPTVPPSGMSTLKTMIENTVLNLGQGATNDMIATNLANAIVMYYVSGGVV